MYYIANARIPTQRAHGLQIMKMCEAFVDNGADVELVLPERFNELSDDPFQYYNVQRNFTIKKLFTIDIAPHREPAHPLFYLLQSLSFAVMAYWYLLQKKDAYIYYRFDKTLLIMFSLFRRRNITCEAHFLITGWQQKLLLNSTNVVVVNRVAKEIYDQKTDFEEKVLTAPDGVSMRDFENMPDRVSARAQLHLPRDKKLVIYTGYFYQWKGIDTLVRAGKFLPRDVHIVMVGGSEIDTFPMRALVQELELDNITFVKFKPYDEIRLYQKAADCLVVTGSAHHPESNLFTSPLKLFEYMASGNPVVASRTRAIEEILQNDRNACLVELDDPKLLADGIGKILSDQSLAVRLAQQAKQDVTQYDWDHRARHIISFIEARASQPKVLYLFAGERRWMVRLWQKGKFPDSQFIGLNHIHNYGVNARFMETLLMNYLRKINFNLAQLPAILKIRRYNSVFLCSNLLFVFLIKKIFCFKKPKIIFYNTFFTNTLKRNTSGWYARIIRSAISSLDMIICPSTAQKEFLEESGFDSKKIIFIPNGVDDVFFKPCTINKNNTYEYILSIGKDMGRDYQTLINAARGLDIKVRIVASLRNLQNIDAIPSNVEVLYDVPQDEIRELYCNAKFVVLPTFGADHLDASDCSGQYVLLESMASGKTVIVTDRNTLKDYVVNGVNAIIVPTQNLLILKEEIKKLLNSPKQIKQIELAARASIEGNNTTEKLAKSLSNIFKL